MPATLTITTATRTSCDVRVVTSFDDFATAEVVQLLLRASAIEDGEQPLKQAFSLALVFVSPSLRTRVGFTVAAGRLGGTAIDVSSQRWDEQMSGQESLEDTIRAVSGMVDLLVVRTTDRLERSSIEANARCPVISAGDALEHPTQALIDLHAIEAERGPIADLSVAVVGDLGMRAARSLIRCFDRWPPRELALVCPPTRVDDMVVGSGRDHRVSDRGFDELSGVDVVYMVGLPAQRHGDHLDAEARRAYQLDERRLGSLAPDALVLSPLPVIDEISPGARRDSRIRMFQQSDRGVSVRMAVLEHLLAS